jgi:anaerobic magnesium-protoporphyrin IX monomethyl ester cyclase
MRIALIKVQDSTAELIMAGSQYPVNLAYLTQICQNLGHETEIWDFCVEPYEEQYIKEKVRKLNPDIVGLSCVTSAINFGNQIAKWVKEVDENILTLIGGVHVSCLPEETMNEFPIFDLGVLREAEETLPEILEYVEQHKELKGIAGTIYRDNGKIVHAPPRELPDINKIPYPNRDMLPIQWYSNRHAHKGVSRKFWNIIEVDSSRGCPYPCTFCNVEITHGRSMRFRTPENVLGEIEQCVKKYGTNYVIFNDSTFTIDKKRAKEIVEGLPELGIKGFSVNAHVNTVDEELLTAMAKSGIDKLLFGIESGSNKVLKRIGKNASQKSIRRALNLAQKAKIPIVEVNFILGADIHESEEDILETEKLIHSIKFDILAMGIITPFPGTDQYIELKRMGYLDGVPWDSFQIFGEKPPPWRTVNFSNKELVARRNRILKNYYWNLGFIFKRLLKIRTFGELSYYAGMAKSFYKVVARNA